jgi:hypothetical protein
VSLRAVRVPLRKAQTVYPYGLQVATCTANERKKLPRWMNCSRYAAKTNGGNAAVFGQVRKRLLHQDALTR